MTTNTSNNSYMSPTSKRSEDPRANSAASSSTTALANQTPGASASQSGSPSSQTSAGQPGNDYYSNLLGQSQNQRQRTMPEIEPVHPKNRYALSKMLLKGKLRKDSLSKWQTLLSIGAFSIASCLVLTVAGGTWMFVMRSANVPNVFQATGWEKDMVDATFEMYVYLAIVACVLVVAPLATLASSAARLGARSTSYKLAALRLIGLSSSDVMRVCLSEMLRYTIIGEIIGFALYLVTLPLWRFLTMQTLPVDPQEMLLPWWIILICLVVIAAISICSTFFGLQRVRISPLGVSRRSLPKRLSIVRALIFVLVLPAVLMCLPFVQNMVRENASGIAFAIIMMLAFFWALNIVVPWILQNIARLLAYVLPFTSALCAFRRIQMQPKVTWARCSSLALMCFITGLIGFGMVDYGSEYDSDRVTELLRVSQSDDMTKGVLITTCVVLITVAYSVLMTSVSDEIENAERSRSLMRMGVPLSFMHRVAVIELVVPLLGCLVMLFLGNYMYRISVSSTLAARFASNYSSWSIASLALGYGLIILAVEVVNPLRKRIIQVNRRKND